MPHSLFTAFRRVALLILSLVVALFGFVQFERYLLRHRAERLHSETLALQIHPGTFADIQRLEHEWGHFAHYDGKCAADHCIYNIVLSDDIDHFLYRPDHAAPKWMDGLGSALGQRHAIIQASLGIHDNRMWRENFSVIIEAESFGLIANVESGSHLFSVHEYAYASDLMRGYYFSHGGACSGCVIAEVHFSPQASAADITHLSKINMACITRWKACVTGRDLLPNAWPQYVPIEGSIFHELDLRPVPVTILAREAREIMLVKVESSSIEMSTEGATDPDSGEINYVATARVLERLKNATSQEPGSVVRLVVDGGQLKAPALGAKPFIAGQQYIVLFREPYEIEGDNLEIMMTMPLTEANLQAVHDGVAADPLTGETADVRYH
jgi:hypothetical protein